MRPMTRDEVREFDRRAIEDVGVPGIVLMENAGRQAADAAEQMLRDAGGRRAVIVAGRGNNGGDGFVIARHLATRGYEARVLLVADPGKISGDAATNLAVLGPLGIEVRPLAGDADEVRTAILRAAEEADVVIDALLGTGLQGNVREPHLSAIEAMNASGRPVLAVDIPSGLDADTGLPQGAAVVARTTITFAATKLGFLSPEAAAFVGRLAVADIGVPRKY
ncbi:MAG: NAD(P)H-hydrate epimerase [Planctomycetes bacterium]|nr:NAD(P)H-hydrate epimerase [Planctomycetota bacterium]